MNTTNKTLIATAVAAALLTGCTTAPVKPAGAAQARSKLTQLQADANLGSRAPEAIKEADAAVRTAETPEINAPLAAHRVYMADRKVDTARALAEARFAEDQRAALSTQRESARLDARTREADAAHAAAGSSEQQATDLQRQLDEMQAKVTDRGVVLTLGDVLFTSGKADLQTGATGNLNKLIAFLGRYPDRIVTIEGYTDSMGSEDYNRGLSERRADSVKSYLVGQGIGAMRLTASGKGESDPVADNGSATGRQQNRRVEVIISSPATALSR